MTRRRRDPAAHLRGNILDPLPGQEHLEGLTLLERASLTPRQRQAPIGPNCCCPPPEAGRLGGQRPMLRWASAEALQAYCGTCKRTLDSAHHRRRAGQHVMGLAKLPFDHLDPADLVDAGLMRPEHLEPSAVDVTGIADDMPPTRRRRSMAAAVLSDEEAEQLQRMAQPIDLEALAADVPLEALLRP